MQFDAREVKEDAKFVPNSGLVEGSVYFHTTYVDDDFLVPELRSIVFIGRNLQPDDIDVVYFQDAYSFHQGVRFPGSKDSEAEFFGISDEDFAQEFEEALNGLLRCSIKRKDKGVTE